MVCGVATIICWAPSWTFEVQGRRGPNFAVCTRKSNQIKLESSAICRMANSTCSRSYIVYRILRILYDIYIHLHHRAYNLAQVVSFMDILGRGRRDARAERGYGLVRAEIGMRGERLQTPATACYTHSHARTLYYGLIDLFCESWSVETSKIDNTSLSRTNSLAFMHTPPPPPLVYHGAMFGYHHGTRALCSITSCMHVCSRTKRLHAPQPNYLTGRTMWHVCSG